jgi:hypothetical protein
MVFLFYEPWLRLGRTMFSLMEDICAFEWKFLQMQQLVCMQVFMILFMETIFFCPVVKTCLAENMNL